MSAFGDSTLTRKMTHKAKRVFFMLNVMFEIKEPWIILGCIRQNKLVVVYAILCND
jgi:hypothetical protein